jgi:hypothetical protein
MGQNRALGDGPFSGFGILKRHDGMTEAVSRNGGEDVLSSIRRLVAQEVPLPEPTKPATQEKLLLTPALRVDDAEQSALDAGRDTVQAAQQNASAPAEFAPAQTQGAGQAPEAGPASGSAPALDDPVSEVGVSADDPAMSDAQMTTDTPYSAPSPEDRALDATLARLQAVLSGATRPAGTEALSGDEGPLDDVIDEGMLYQIVAHIVRQELQGELGEKITRNIRKLVRAEVARELQLRQL